MQLDTVLQSIFSIAFLATIIRVATPILLPALGGLVAELAGVGNIALEGIMLFAAFFGVIISAFALQWMPGLSIWAAAWMGALAGVLIGMLLAWLIAFFHIELGTDIFLAALGINTLAQGGTIFLMFVITGDKGSTATLASPALPNVVIPFVNNIRYLGTLLNAENLTGYNVLTYVAVIALIVVHVFLYRTPLGTHLRAVGENPEAAASVGINVKRVRYIALLISGFLAALGGLNLSMGYLSLFQANMTAGRGFIALAVIYLGNKHPIGVLLAALIFGAASGLENRLGTLDQIPSQLFPMIPPLVTIIALVLYNVRRQRQLLANVRKFQEKAAVA